MDQNWDDLRYFLALARATTLSTAADRLRVSHTTVLRRVRSLEEDVRTRLFERTRDGYALTAHGERLLAEAEKVEGALAAIGREIAGADERIEGAVAITAPPAIANHLLPEVLLGLKERHPELAVQLRVSAQVVDLARREADIAIRVTPSPPESLIGRRIGELGLLICASEAYLRDHPYDVPATTLDGHRFVVDDMHLPTPPMRWLTPHLGSPAITLTDDVVSTAKLCAAGLGLALVPRFLAEQEGLVVLDPAPMPSIPVWILTHRDLRSAARIRATMAFLAEALRRVFPVDGDLKHADAGRDASRELPQ